MKKAMVEGIEILNITMLEDGAKNAMASVAAAEYSVKFREGYAPDFDWPGQLISFYQMPSR